MSYNPYTHRRKSTRLTKYDYSQSGAYFVTICAHERECLFGKIVDGRIELSNIGKIVASEWIKTGEIRTEVELDKWVIMPNHFHAIISITTCRGDQRSPNHSKLVSKSVGAIMAGFKSAVTKQVNILRQTPKLPLWQRNYWDHVVRDDTDLNRIREYISTNPLLWELDSLNPNI